MQVVSVADWSIIFTDALLKLEPEIVKVVPPEISTAFNTLELTPVITGGLSIALNSVPV